MADAQKVIEALRRCEGIIVNGCDGCPFESEPLTCSCLREAAANIIEELLKQEEGDDDIEDNEDID